jgi:phosphoribosylaminoimidazole-succinocarboxamide synthase
MTDEFVNLVSERYIELYEQVTGLKFKKADVSEIPARVEANILKYLSSR